MAGTALMDSSPTSSPPFTDRGANSPTRGWTRRTRTGPDAPCPRRSPPRWPRSVGKAQARRGRTARPRPGPRQMPTSSARPSAMHWTSSPKPWTRQPTGRPASSPTAPTAPTTTRSTSCAASLPEPARTDRSRPECTDSRPRPTPASRPGSGPMLARTRTIAHRRESQPHESRPHEAQSHEYEGVPMTVNFAAGPQTTQLWERVRPIVAQIEDLPFLAQLADGSLDVTAFTNYIIQDGIYLNG